MKKSTNELLQILELTPSENLEDYLSENQQEFFLQEKPFASYMRKVLAEHGVQQRDVFMRMDISQSFGYQLISEEKRTKQRDYILKFCIAGELTLNETQRALQLYGMSPLYARLPRDAVLISAIRQEKKSIDTVNDLLKAQGMTELKRSDRS